MKKARRSKLQLFITLIIMGLCATPIAAQTSAFNYQGKLTDAGNPATGQFDFQFKLFDTQSVGTGTQQGGDVNVANVTVTNGSFSVPLDFGACASCFNGAARFLEIAVKPTSSGTFTTLAPRQPITSTPYAIRSQNAAMATLADGLSVACVNCVTSSHIASVNGSVVSGTIPVASVPAGSSNYIQNTTTAQAGSDFNISGNGTAGGILSGNLVNAATQFNLGGSRILSAPWFGNLFAGINAGINITDGQQNSFFGYHAGQANTNGFYNSFFGSQAGSANTSGDGNSFFGNGAGFANTTGFDNAFFGYSAGQSNTTGLVNSFFGSRAGTANTTGGGNSFVGTAAGTRNTTGNHNTFIGVGADFATSNPTGDDNTLLGYNTHVNSGLSNATAIGANASVTQSNSLVLGNGVNVGIGTATPSAKLEVVHPISQLRFGPTIADNGGYLISTVPHQAIIIGGAKFDGTNWIARDTVASMTAHQFGAIQFFTNDGLTVGNPFSPFVRMHIGTNGFVGIGTTAPEQALDVNGKIQTSGPDAALAFRDRTSASGTDVWALYTADGIARLFNVLNGDVLAVTRNGFVGIGTTAPQTRLHVEGSGSVESTVKSINERAILALDSTLAGQRRVWTLESGIFGTANLFGIYDRTAGQARLLIDSAGVVGVKILAIQGGADFSENFDISEENGTKPGVVANEVAPGLVVSIDQKNPGKLVLSHQAYDRRVAGIISGAGGVSPGLVMGQKDSVADGKYPVALSGRVWVYADASRQPIKPGDLLTTSAIPGHAMKVMNHRKANGAIIGKAMTALKSGTGLVLVLVSLQ